MGVWIETFDFDKSTGKARSHPTWVCGLKPTGFVISVIDTKSHPTWVCGLKPAGYHRRDGNRPSHPTWVCGLKHKDFLLDITGEMESHPTWVCGLKHQWPSIRQYRRWSHPAWEYMDWSIVHSSVKFMEEL
ncbi:hypothetical protein [Phocaeicola dorei]|uniref:hypothetical protein n=1 Tax=Phocaeicola dorei TaxID=357276 RepID=UPI00397C8E33